MRKRLGFLRCLCLWLPGPARARRSLRTCDQGRHDELNEVYMADHLLGELHVVIVKMLLAQAGSNDASGIVNRVQLLLCPEEELSGGLTVTPITQVEVQEYRVLPRFLLQIGESVFCLGDIRRSDVNGSIVV